jgi:hypothetical protein
MGIRERERRPEMLKVVLIDSREGWLLKAAASGVRVSGQAFRTTVAARKWLEVNWPGSEVIRVEDGGWS